MIVGILDYGMGNLRSVKNAFEYIGASVTICNSSEDLQRVDRIVIPGVGAFKDCISKLHSDNFIPTLNDLVLKDKKPALGICLGMQVMANNSSEGGVHKGLGWFDAEVVKLNPKSTDLKVPNIGWNEVTFNKSSSLFKKIPQLADLYFVHSYYMKCNNEHDVIATYDFSFPVTAAISKENIFATQFHPEKSQDIGLRIIENFIDWKP